MIKAESLKELQGILKEKGIELTLAQVEDVLDGVEELCAKVIEAKDSVTLNGFIKISTKEKAERHGTTNLPGKEATEWTKPACIVPDVKFTKGFVEKHTIEK